MMTKRELRRKLAKARDENERLQHVIESIAHNAGDKHRKWIKERRRRKWAETRHNELHAVTGEWLTEKDNRIQELEAALGGSADVRVVLMPRGCHDVEEFF